MGGAATRRAVATAVPNETRGTSETLTANSTRVKIACKRIDGRFAPYLSLFPLFLVVVLASYRASTRVPFLFYLTFHLLLPLLNDYIVRSSVES